MTTVMDEILKVVNMNEFPMSPDSPNYSKEYMNLLVKNLDSKITEDLSIWGEFSNPTMEWVNA
ncbi:hypothetical protein A2W14_07210 [Candidatus Gottesmanbacteria bacterium RBG_16_37_8]|uniref:Uncharacterized protein n=1 Tax=Candidatus Gottesmanbacteria bacterium RBG_16_37_8 TaxID=1798371 RepID=A0A1F5YS40_9BACT|nr:MAG: hypothetical protein A2W14_07210 [Candidatus Gottesmanbacteria bacterium RBG_16_37_8]